MVTKGTTLGATQSATEGAEEAQVKVGAEEAQVKVGAEEAQLFNRLSGVAQPPLDGVMDVPVRSTFDRQERINIAVPVAVRNWKEYLLVSRRAEVAKTIARVRALHEREAQLRIEAVAARDAGAAEEADRLEAEAKEVDEKKKAAKTSLPAFIVGATVDGKERKEENARASAFFSVDADHLREAPQAVWRRCLGKAREAGVVMAFVSPSGDGLKLFCQRRLSDTLADQLRVVRELGLPEENLDKACKDLARCAFVTTEKDILYFDPRLAASPTRPLSAAPALAPASAKDEGGGEGVKAGATPAAAPAADYPTDFKGVDLKLIARQLVKGICGAEVPLRGSRNNTLYEAACALRYCCDFRPAWIAPLLPPCGLTAEEVSRLCDSACRAERSSGNKAALSKAVEALRTAALPAAPERPEWDEAVRRPALPPGLQELVNCCPPDLRDAVTLSSLPCLGTLGTGIRAYSKRTHDDDLGQLQTPTFFVLVEAFMAGNKSVIKTLMKRIMEPLIKQDEEMLKKEQEWKDECDRLSKVAKAKPPRPDVVVRIISPSISKTELYRRQEAAGGRHMLKWTAELSQATNYKKRGDWADSTSDDKMAFDNDSTGQDHAKADSFNVRVPLFYNILYLTTPGEREKYLSNKEDGSITRYIIVEMPYEIGAPEPYLKRLTPEGEANLEKLQETLMGIGNGGKRLYDLRFLDLEREKWVKKMNAICKRTQDPALYDLFKRCAVVGFRAAMLIAACWDAEGNWDEKMKKAIKQFFHYVAVYQLRTLMKRYAADVRANHAAHKATPHLPYERIYNALPQEFTTDLLSSTARELGINHKGAKIASLWKKAGAVERIAHGTYRKPTPPPAA